MNRALRAPIILLACTTMAACTTASSPFADRQVGPDRPDRAMCAVRVENGTSYPLSLSYWITGGGRAPLGEAAPDQSMSFGVACDTQRIFATGVGPVERGGQAIFRKSVSVDRAAEETRIKLTIADRVR